MQLTNREDVYMTYTNLFHMAFYCAALLVCLTSIAFTIFQKRTDLTHNKIFLLMNYIVLINGLTCFLLESIEPLIHLSYAFYHLRYGLELFYFIVHSALAPTLFNYVMNVTRTSLDRPKYLKFICLFPFILTEIFVCLNPLTHYVYWYDEDLLFHRNWGENFIYIIAMIYTSIAFTNLLLSWHALRRRNRYSMIYFFCLTLFGVIVQFINIGIKSELFCEALALVGLMLAVESEDDRIDTETNVYNRNALKNDVKHLLMKRHSMNVLCLKITNIDMISKNTGVSNSDEIMKEITDYLKTLVPRQLLYHADENTMVLLQRQDSFEKNNFDIIDFANNIYNRFQDDWIVHGVSIRFTPVIMIGVIPSQIKSLEDLLYMIDSPVPKDFENTILLNEDLYFFIRRAAVESAVSNGLKNGSFEVYYQPTHCLNGLRLHGAEALIRLHDKKIGDVYPEEFIPIAEQAGYIDDIDDFVLNQVCAFIKTGEPMKLGMDCINVNLSVLQCMGNGFVNRILGIVDKYDIPKNFINFEITESVSASDYELLADVIKELKSNGFLFSMDDYGTGYSNMHTLFSLDFDIVKIDKSILWDAENSEIGQIILENCVHMIRQMKRKILVEGVETQSQIDKLQALGVDYLQGYYFSKPITKSALLKYCEAI